MPSDVEPTRADLIALIDWLALPYASDPIFVYDEEEAGMMLVSEQSLEYRRRLRDTWRYVVGTKNATVESESVGG